MRNLRRLRKGTLPVLLLTTVLLAIAVYSFQSAVNSSPVDPGATATPTLAPVAITDLTELPTIVAPSHLELEPERPDPFPEVGECDSDWVQNEVLAAATSEAREVRIDCDLTLDAEDVVTKRLIFETSGVNVDCNSAAITGGDGSDDSANNVNFRRDMIEVRSPSSLDGEERVWRRTRSVTIRDCIVTGSIRVWGMAKNGQGTLFAGAEEGEVVNVFRTSSREEGHAERARANAPTDIVFDNLTITGVGRNPVYFAPGVTYSQLINSEIKGRSDAVGFYLDAESYANTIKNNYIHVATKNHPLEQWDRPLVAIDGSSHNKIINNRFSNLSHGGIYLYRNCGEGGVVRHTTPSYNQIINNIFYYNRYSGDNPSVYFGSRDYGWFQETFGYCEDDGVPDTITEIDFGSGASNKDHATHNVVMQNQIFKRSVGDMIKTNNPAVNSPNYVDYNHTVTAADVVYNGLAGCYVPGGYRDFILHGAVVDVYRGGDDIPICTTYRDTCNDGELLRTANNSCELTTFEFDCSVSGDNDGCIQDAICPAGRRIVAATAACNLEWGSISDATMLTIPGNVIRVLRASDSVSSGRCNVGSIGLREGSARIDDLVGSFGVSVGCKEYDGNGGDCQIRGTLYCR